MLILHRVIDRIVGGHVSEIQGAAEKLPDFNWMLTSGALSEMCRDGLIGKRESQSFVTSHASCRHALAKRHSVRSPSKRTFLTIIRWSPPNALSELGSIFISGVPAIDCFVGGHIWGKCECGKKKSFSKLPNDVLVFFDFF